MAISIMLRFPIIDESEIQIEIVSYRGTSFRGSFIWRNYNAISPIFNILLNPVAKQLMYLIFVKLVRYDGRKFVMKVAVILLSMRPLAYQKILLIEANEAQLSLREPRQPFSAY